MCDYISLNMVATILYCVNNDVLNINTPVMDASNVTFINTSKRQDQICLGPWLSFRRKHLRAETERVVASRKDPACIIETEQKAERWSIS